MTDKNQPAPLEETFDSQVNPKPKPLPGNKESFRENEVDDKLIGDDKDLYEATANPDKQNERGNNNY